jgi:HSP20 family protein
MTTLKFKNGELRDAFLPRNFGPILETFFHDMPASLENAAFRPAADIIEKDNTYEIRLSLAGYRKEDIQIDLEGNKLTVSGKRELTEEEKSEKYHVSEIRRGAFSRTFSLAKNANADGIEAEFQDGILKIAIPKAELQGKKIEIK